MENPTSKKEKVIIIPRPPRSANPELVPVDTPCPPCPEQVANQAGPHDAPGTQLEPGVGPLNNQVTGPAEGLVGVPKED